MRRQVDWIFSKNIVLCSVFKLLIITSSFRAATELDMGLGSCPVMVAVYDGSLTCKCHWDQNFQLPGNSIRAWDTFPAFPQIVFLKPHGFYLHRSVAPARKELKDYYLIPANSIIFSDKAYLFEVICCLIVPFVCMPGIFRYLAAHSATALAGCRMSGQLATATGTQIGSVSLVCWWPGIAQF